MADLLLTAHAGRDNGTRSSRRLRRDGIVPAVLYGLGLDPVAVSVPWPELRRVLTTDAGLNALITLDVDGTKNLTLVKEMQRHPVRRDVTHVDFLRVDPDKEIGVDVQIVLTGEAKEVENENGLVDQTLFSLAVLCKPNAIPQELTVDITDMIVGGAIHVSDLVMPAGSRTEVNGEDTVAVAVVTRSTLEAMAADEAAEAAADEAALDGGDASAGAADGESSGDE